MRRTGKRRRQFREGVSLRRVDLGLGKKNTFGKVGPPKIGIPKIRPDEVGTGQVVSSKVGGNKACPSQIGSPKVGSSEIGADKVRSPAHVRPVARPSFCSRMGLMCLASFGPNELASVKEKRIHCGAMARHVQFHERVGREACEPPGLFQHGTEGIVHRSGRLQGKSFCQIPKQFMELHHDSKYFEHPFRGIRRFPPCSSPEAFLGNLLARAEAVERDTAFKTSLSEAVVYTAAKVRSKVGAGLTRRFVGRKAVRCREIERDAAQPCTFFAVSP